MPRIPLGGLLRVMSLCPRASQLPYLRPLSPRRLRKLALSNYVAKPSRPLCPRPSRPILSPRMRIWIWMRSPQTSATPARRSSLKLVACAFRRTFEEDMVSGPSPLKECAGYGAARQIRGRRGAGCQMWPTWRQTSRKPSLRPGICIAVWLADATVEDGEHLRQGGANGSLGGIMFSLRKYAHSPLSRF